VPSLDQLLVFSLAAAVVIAIPGPSVIFLVQVLAVAFGIGTLVEGSAPRQP
jgi:hypothetical protein